jgi:hypothetical protein
MSNGINECQREEVVLYDGMELKCAKEMRIEFISSLLHLFLASAHTTASRRRADHFLLKEELSSLTQTMNANLLKTLVGASIIILYR